MISWAGCDTVVAEPARTYKIGVVLGLTGAAATWSESARQGLEMAQEEINQSGGIRGRRLDLLFEDSGTEAARSVSAYKKLVEVQGVRIIVGDIWAHLINAILPLAEKDRVLLIAPTVSDDDPALKGQYFFTMGNRVNSVRRAVSQFFEINPEVKRVGILCFDNSWGHAYSKMWHEVATENGVTVVGEVCSFGFTDTHRTEIAKFRALGADAIIAAEWTDQVLKTMKEQRMASKLLGTSNVTEALYVRNSSNDLMEGTFFTDWSPSDEFISRFKQRYGKDPILGAHNAYEILRSIAKALTISDQDVASALRTVHYEGVGGSIDFRNGMFANMSVGSLFTVKSRKVVAIQ
jgi:ABC-type branched-subunit amino acid transport system substrate-binding protein